MPVSIELIDEHVQTWESRLSFGHRRHWPSRLFRHEALENAVEVLRAGHLLSRADANDRMVRDIAPAEIIAANDIAHNFTRLYFRPRTPTQYRIEGIRRQDEVWNGRHAPVIFMFVFKKRLLLSRPQVYFSNGNMQAAGAEILDGDEAFASLAFDKIFHEGSYSPEHADIKVWRCAEVLTESPLLLDDALEAVVCRSDAERKTLLFALGQDSARWADRIRVMSQPGYFNAEYAFVEAVDLNPEGVKVVFHPRIRIPSEGRVSLSVCRSDNILDRRDFKDRELDLRKVWNFGFPLSAGQYMVEIHLESELAYRNILDFDVNPV